MRHPTTRSSLRTLHLAGGVALAAFVYSPTLQASALVEAVLGYGVIPALGISGIAMWKPRLLRRITG